MREFETGAVRDDATGKGQYDLLPWGAIHDLAQTGGSSGENGRIGKCGLSENQRFESILKYAMKGKNKQMSRPRYDWWPYVKGMIRRYPALKREFETLHEQSVTANYSGMPRGGGVSRGTEMIAIRELPTTKQREYEAVRMAVEKVSAQKNGKEILDVINLYLWKRSHTLDGAAVKTHIGARTAKRYHSDFVRLVAKNYGLLDE